MPFYEFMCTSCGYKFEKFKHITDDSTPKCSKCFNDSKQLISSVSGQTIRNANETLEIIKEEARKDREDIQNGDWEKAADYLGEDGALEYYGEK